MHESVQRGGGLLSISTQMARGGQELLPELAISSQWVLPKHRHRMQAAQEKIQKGKRAAYSIVGQCHLYVGSAMALRPDDRPPPIKILIKYKICLRLRVFFL